MWLCPQKPPKSPVRFNPVRYHLGMAYLATGQKDKASDEFNKARKLAPDDAELGAKIDGALKSRPEKAKG